MVGRRRAKSTPQSKLDATPPWPVRERPAAAVTTGPYDVADAPEDGLPRIDVGALQVPPAPGFELRLELTEAQQVMSVTLANASGHMQLGVFAAPRTSGIWEEVRTEILDSVRAQGGSLKQIEDGPFGIELTGNLKTDGKSTPVRFIGIDGPRWFLRAMLVGSVVTDAAKARPLEAALRDVIVVRGGDPLPVREQVPLHLPKDVLSDDDVEQLENDAVGEPAGDGIDNASRARGVV